MEQKEVMDDVNLLVGEIKERIEGLQQIIESQKDGHCQRLLAAFDGTKGIKKQIEGFNKSLGSDIEALRPHVCNYMSEHEQSKLMIGGVAVGLSTGVNVKVKDEFKAVISEICERVGLSDLVKSSVNTTTLKSWVTEQERDDDLSEDQDGNIVKQFEMPDELAAALLVTEFTTARVSAK